LGTMGLDCPAGWLFAFAEAEMMETAPVIVTPFKKARRLLLLFTQDSFVSCGN
jgi:hypothetical protein